MISFLVNQSLGHHAVRLPKQPKVLMQPHVTPRQGSEVSTQVLHLSPSLMALDTLSFAVVRFAAYKKNPDNNTLTTYGPHPQ